ncbi:hypothetical protein KL86DYS2_10430 [uncultured Dysgonomonas sp.]|uniref:Uncharacterized protein n=1 Tax=uncultured Dysgonomonas sp. TaxID=206096 RepID=A0A212J024_9BACT|nr:hypothetical protein KL86DYS2_10430 [uncultured Dysgonomonas sp.]
MFIIILSLNILKPELNNIYGSNKEKETCPNGSLFWGIQTIWRTLRERSQDSCQY